MKRARSKAWAAPTAGWVTNENLATARPGSARVLDNWFPESDTTRVRGGLEKHATLNADVESVFVYRNGATETLFAADATSIYDVTSPASATTPPTAVISGLSGGNHVTAQMTTSGGVYLYAVNGLNNPILYDGTTWMSVTTVSTPALTNVTLADLNFVFTFKSRLFFLQKGSLSFAYLAVDSIGGSLTEFSLAGVVSEGGALIAGGTWSGDSGDGFDDRCYFLTNRGEVVVYQGTDPGSNWSLVGVYRVGPPMGPLGIVRIGGDPIFVTEAGMVPLSVAATADPVFLSDAAVTKAIEPTWTAETRQRTGLDWFAVKWEAENKILVGMPVSTATTATPAQCFVANAETNAWCRYTGWNVRCGAELGRKLYLGQGASVFDAEETGLDDDATYTARMQLQPDDLGNLGVEKTALMMRAAIRANNAMNVKLSCAVDYAENFPAAPDSATATNIPLWGTAVWGTAVWGGGSVGTVETAWKSVVGAGYSHSPQVQITSGNATRVDVRLISIRMNYEEHREVA